MLRRLGTLSAATLATTLASTLASTLATTLAVAAPAAAQPTSPSPATWAATWAATSAATSPPTAATVADRQAAYRAALDRMTALSTQYQRVATMATVAEDRAEMLRAEAGVDDSGLIDTVTGFLSGEPSALDLAAEAAQDAADARELADLVHVALVEQIAAVDAARDAWTRAEQRRMRAEAALSAREYAEQAIAYARFLPGYTAADAEEDARNRTALAAWHDYLRSVADAAVVPPALAELSDPADLPDGLARARTGFAVSPGVATAERPRAADVTVLSAEAVRAVSEAFRRVGQPAPGETTPYACGGLVADVWAGPGRTVPTDAPDQWSGLPTVRRAALEMGDVVLLGSRRKGLAETGVYVGAGRAVVADATTGVATVQPVTGLLGVRRVGVHAGAARGSAPEGGACGVQPAAPPTTGGPFLVPVAPGTYSLTSDFGEAGPYWSSGHHTGLDFAAPTGTPIVAAAGGVVTVEQPGWAGSLVRIDHGNGLETWYAHLSRTDVVSGQVVAPGAPVGLVGEAGNTTGPHLHFEVRLDGTAYDPAPLLGLVAAGPAARQVVDALR